MRAAGEGMGHLTPATLAALWGAGSYRPRTAFERLVW